MYGRNLDQYVPPLRESVNVWKIWQLILENWGSDESVIEQRRNLMFKNAEYYESSSVASSIMEIS